MHIVLFMFILVWSFGKGRIWQWTSAKRKAHQLGESLDSNCLRVQPNADSAARLESVLRPLHYAAMQWLSKTLTRAVSAKVSRCNSRNRLKPTIVTHTNSFKRTPP